MYVTDGKLVSTVSIISGVCSVHEYLTDVSGNSEMCVSMGLAHYLYTGSMVLKTILMPLYKTYF